MRALPDGALDRESPAGVTQMLAKLAGLASVFTDPGWHISCVIAFRLHALR